ncbi:MAG: hypothetical protein U0441_23575 [Polyangiaceae bacterium]
MLSSRLRPFGSRGGLLVTALLATLLGACSGSDTSGSGTTSTTTITGPDDGLSADCNPLRGAGACLLPYPSAVFTKDDATSPTGLRVDLTPELFPVNVDGVKFDPARLNALDGFSPATQIVAYFPERLDGASLPPLKDPDASTKAGAATVIVDMETGEKVAHFAEVDAQSTKEDDRQTLLIRPMKRLENGRRYAVAITKSLKTLDGKTPPPPAGFDAILAGTAESDRAKRQAARMPEILSALDKAGVAKADLLVAWDFVTATEESDMGPILSMRQQTIDAFATETFKYTIDKVEDDFSPRALRRITGHFEAPKFISQTALNVPEATLTFDKDKKPVRDGNLTAPFTLILPRAATKGAVRLLVFGHGFLGSGESELGGSGGSYLQDFLDEKGFAAVATDWSGLSAYEGIDPAGSQAAALAVKDMNHLNWIGDRLQQAIVNVTVLAHIAPDIAADPALDVNAAPSIDGSRVDYYGISLGGVMGSVMMAASPDLGRGVLNVGAASWTTLLQRSTNWTLFKLILDGQYQDRLDQQEIVCVLQNYLDGADGINWAHHYKKDLFPGVKEKGILLQIGVGDLQVSNVASAMLARTAELPLLDSSPIDFWGLTSTAGPLPSALSVFDTKEKDQPPEGNMNGNVTSMNAAHATIRALPAAMDQMDHFLRQGEVIATCDGKCDPE